MKDYNLKEGEPEILLEELIAWWETPWQMARVNECRPVKRPLEWSRRETMVAWMG